MSNTTPTISQKFFLYARKSTDVEDKQVRSIEDQISELRVHTRAEGLNVIEELVEKTIRENSIASYLQQNAR